MLIRLSAVSIHRYITAITWPPLRRTFIGHFYNHSHLDHHRNGILPRHQNGTGNHYNHQPTPSILGGIFPIGKLHKPTINTYLNSVLARLVRFNLLIWSFRRNPLRRQHSPYYRRHRIYPVFGKRSIHIKDDDKGRERTKGRRHGISSEEPGLWDRLHVQYHRSSRQDLYTRIEKYLNK